MLVGPWVGALCVTVVLLVQALLFADGGLSALGLNVVNMAIVGAWGGYVVFLGVRRLLPARRSSVVAASAVAAGAGAGAGRHRCSRSSTPSAATAPHRSATVAAAMVGVHVLIGIGEGVITALTVSAVMATRPDLVYGARGLRAGTAVRRPSAGAAAAGGRRAPRAVRRPMHRRPGEASGRDASRSACWSRVGLLVALLLAFVVSPFASSSPDGLEKVAADKAIDRDEQDHALADGPLADYSVEGVDDERLGTGLAGVVGVAVTFAVGGGLFVVLRRTGGRRSRPGRRSPRSPPAPPIGGAGHERRPRRGVRRRPPLRPRAQPPAPGAARVQGRGHGPLRAGGRRHAPGGVLGVRLLRRRAGRSRRRRRACRSGSIGRRLAIEVPFVAFALLLPFVGQGERVEVLGLSLSVAGLWAAWNILVKATLGVAATVLLAATTPVPDLLRGLERLRGAPRAGGDLRVHGPLRRRGRRRDAPHADRAAVPGLRRPLDLAGPGRGRLGRGAVRPLLRAGRAGHLAMLSRGYDRRDAAQRPVPPRRRGQWGAALAVPAVAAVVSALAWLVR